MRRPGRPAGRHERDRESAREIDREGPSARV